MSVFGYDSVLLGLLCIFMNNYTSSRNQLIEKIEGIRRSRVITYITSDRQGPANAGIAMDINQ